MTKALVLFSGGLDSLLAVKILEKQGIKAEGICFVSNFFDCKKAQEAAKENNIKLHIKDISREMVNLVKNPERGFGRNMNPCIDCHALMIKLAGRFAREEEFDLIATGEVLGQRPFSQNKQALREVVKKSGVDVLRPLSAKLLEETSFESRGLADRNKLEDIQGRERKKQEYLARELGIKNYETPAGGCLLTDPEFSSRLRKMKEKKPDFDFKDVELLKRGRIFWFNLKEKPALLVVGRNKEENNELEQLAENGDLVVKTKSVTGPVSLLRNFKGFEGDLREGKEEKRLFVPKELKPEEKEKRNTYCLSGLLRRIFILTGWYSVKGRDEEVDFIAEYKGGV
jgi:tRNA U34 2-thiouridine synthase MnmA/TrmU